MQYWFAGVDFDSPLSLEETAACLSSHVFGGVQFGGRDEYVKDEVPALVAQKSVLGCYIVIYGSGADGYRLEMQSQLRSDANSVRTDAADIFTEIDLSELLTGALLQIPHFTLRGDG